MKFFAVICSMFLSLESFAVYVKPYRRRDGTYVQGHHRTAPNHTITDNYSYNRNTNNSNTNAGTGCINSPSSGDFVVRPPSNEIR